MNYTFRMHDPRVGRFFAVDPLTKEYPELTPYQFASNSVIDMVEIEGLEGGWIVGSQGQVQYAALGPVNDRYFNWFFDAYSSASLNIQQPSSFNTLRAYARTPSVQVPQAQVREVTIESHQKQHSNHYLAAHDPFMKGIGGGLLAGSTGFVFLEGYAAYSAWFGTTAFAETVTGSGWIPALQSQFAVNTFRTAVVGGGAEITSQYAFKTFVYNDFSLGGFDYGDICMATLTGGKGGLFIRSFTNIKAEDGFSVNSLEDTTINYTFGRVSSKINSSISTRAAPLFSTSAMGAYLEASSQAMTKAMTKMVKQGLTPSFMKKEEKRKEYDFNRSL